MEVRAGGQQRSLPAFGLGVMVGLLVACGVVGSQLLLLHRRGIEVRVNTAQIALQVRTEVQATIAKELPSMVDRLRREIPTRVAAETAQRLAETKLSLGGFQVPLPAVAVQQVQWGMEEALRRGLDGAVKSADLDQIAQRMGDQAFVLVNQRLDQGLIDKTFVVRPYPWFSMPVTVRAAEHS